MSTTLTVLNAAVDVLAVQDPGTGVPAGGDKATMVASWFKWGAGIACFIGLMVCVIAMAVSHQRGSGGQHGAAVGWVAGAAVLLGAGAGILTALGA